ncbi:MAG: cell division protein FtsN [Legionella sp. 40-6]|nr:SPOR domain-containing protein [Legionella sp.]OJY57149.1 MAG: cell division protein FtsN [Legionella sp. 40-6]
MGREYNKRTTRGRTSTPNQLLIILVTFFLGYLTATVCDIDTISRWLDKQVMAHNEERNSSEPKKERIAEKKSAKPKFEFYTLLTNDEAGRKEKPTAQTQLASHPVNHAQEQTTNTPPVQNLQLAANSAAKAAPVAAPAVKVAEAKPISPAIAVPARGSFSVQVAAFKARQDAEHMKGLLTLKGFNVSVNPINHPSRGLWYRVMVGPYANRALAQKAQVDLARTERLKGMVTAG